MPEINFVKCFSVVDGLWLGDLVMPWNAFVNSSTIRSVRRISSEVERLSKMGSAVLIQLSRLEIEVENRVVSSLVSLQKTTDGGETVCLVGSGGVLNMALIG